MRPAIKPPRTPEQVPLSTLLRQFINADKADTEARRAWEREQIRVRRLYPRCPHTIVFNFNGEARHRPADIEDVADLVEQGDLSAADAEKWRADLVKWQAACDAMDAQHLNRDLERAATAAEELLEDLDRRFCSTPAKTLADISAKLDYFGYFKDVDDDRAKKVVLGLRRAVRGLMREAAQ